jgi:hypothetical protein
MDLRGVAIPLSGAVLAGLLSGLLAGCGSGGATIRSSTAADLHRQVDAVRKAVAGGSDSAAVSAVADLRMTIRQLANSGKLNPDDGSVLLTQVDRIATDIDHRATPTPTRTPAPAPTPTSTSVSGPGNGPRANNGNGNGDGKDKPKGKDKHK